MSVTISFQIMLAQSPTGLSPIHRITQNFSGHNPVTNHRTYSARLAGHTSVVYKFSTAPSQLASQQQLQLSEVRH